MQQTLFGYFIIIFFQVDLTNIPVKKELAICNLLIKTHNWHKHKSFVLYFLFFIGNRANRSCGGV